MVRLSNTLVPRQFGPEFDRFFDLFDLGQTVRSGMAGSGRDPAIAVWEENDNYVLEAELPGVKAEDLEISAEGQELTIAGKWRVENKEENGEESGVRYLRQERSSGEFRRVLMLPEEINSDAVEASLAEGVLKLTLPKMEAVKPRKIEVRTS